SLVSQQPNNVAKGRTNSPPRFRDAAIWQIETYGNCRSELTPGALQDKGRWQLGTEGERQGRVGLQLRDKPAGTVSSQPYIRSRPPQKIDDSLCAGTGRQQQYKRHIFRA